MLTKSDKQFFKDNFATKDDLKKGLKPINTKLKKIKDSLDLAIDVFDKHIIYHHK